MEDVLEEVRKSIISENLFIQSFSGNKIDISDKYIIGKKIEGINLSDSSVIDEIDSLEHLFRDKGKCSFVLDPSSRPKDIKSILINRGYTKDSNYDDVWWVLDLDKYQEIVSDDNIADLKIIDNYEKLKNLLDNTELDWWADVFGRSLKANPDNLKINLYIGMVKNKLVSACALAIFKDISIYKGAEVTESFRRRGINTQMMRRVIKDSKENGCRWCIYQTSSANIPSIKSGEKMGFKKWFVRELYYKNLTI